jgi:Tfp pilus assembly PilM family ATPase
MARMATGVDIGTSTAKLIRGQVKERTFVVSDFMVGSNPDGSLAGGWNALEGLKRRGKLRVGLTGREFNVRYTRVPRLPDWQLRKLMRFEAAEVGGQSDTDVSSDFNVLPEIPEIEGEDVVILCMARESLLEEHTQGISSAGGALDCFTPNAIGLYNAFLHFGVVQDDTVLLANIGHENIDVVLVRGTDLLFARNMSGGSKLFDEAIAERFKVDVKRAEAFKIEQGTLDITREFKDSNEEKAARAMTGPAGQVLSLLQSAVLFAKGQVKLSTLKANRVFLCGGGAALDGLPSFLQKAMGVPVELFDPFVVVDTSKLDPAQADLLEEHKLEAVCALGLATTASDGDSYSIEILSESMRKKRSFMQGTSFLLAAGVLAVAYLGLYAKTQSAQLGAKSMEARGLASRLRSASSNHQRTTALLEENRELEATSRELFALKGAGEQMLRTLDTLERKLPQDFWLESMRMYTGFDPELGVIREEDVPIVHLKGRARAGTSAPDLLWETFLGELSLAMPEARLKPQMGQSEFTLDLCSLAPVVESEEDADLDDAGEVGS